MTRPSGVATKMSTRGSCRRWVALLGMVASMNAFACGHNHKHYPAGGITCTAHQQFQCGDGGQWHKIPGHCDADPQPVKTAPDTKAPPVPQPRAG